MPITPGTSGGSAGGNPYQSLLSGFGGLPGYQGQGVPGGLGANFQSIQQLLSQQPQSLTNQMMPGLQQILGLQTQSLLPAYQNQTAQMTANAMSGAQGRGLAGSTIAGANTIGANAAGLQNMNQFIGQQLGTLGNAYSGAMGQDVQAQNQQYQNLAQAFGQQMQSQVDIDCGDWYNLTRIHGAVVKRDHITMAL